MFDTFVYKRLANNDTGKAAGHQAGIVIPKAISDFFPSLPAISEASGPTVDAELVADLFVDGSKVSTVKTRYQYQTWGGTRSPERRLTSNLGALRNLASAGDILLFRKSLDDDYCVQLHLVRRGTKEFERLEAHVGTSTWGVLDRENPPLTNSQISDSLKYVQKQIDGPPTVFSDERATNQTISMRKARDKAFRRNLLIQYDYRCAFTGRKFLSPLGTSMIGLDAAHVVPVAERGSDHPANGLTLTKELHWAFDQGMVGVARDRTILVPSTVRNISGNEFLRDLHGRPLREAKDASCRVSELALEWHRYNRVARMR
ncbi:HNH endonuclease [Rhodovulum sulfidophilum]|nr:HNH endonuclease [Rhodovulum sulfidophilum]